MNCKETQRQIIWGALRKGRHLTPLAAWKLGAGFKLASRISELRADGAQIHKGWQKHKGSRTRVYWLAR